MAGRISELILSPHSWIGNSQHSWRRNSAHFPVNLSCSQIECKRWQRFLFVEATAYVPEEESQTAQDSNIMLTQNRLFRMCSKILVQNTLLRIGQIGMWSCQITLVRTCTLVLAYESSDRKRFCINRAFRLS